MAVFIECKNCGRKEEINKEWILKNRLSPQTYVVMPPLIVRLVFGIAAYIKLIRTDYQKVASELDNNYVCETCGKNQWRIIDDTQS